MSITVKYIPLIDEVINRNPVAVRLNAIRLGLGDESFQLSRQSLMVSISDWQKKNTATEQQVADMLRDVLSVETALQTAVAELTNLKSQPPKDIEVPDWAVYLTGFLLVLGVFAALLGSVKIIQKIFS